MLRTDLDPAQEEKVVDRRLSTHTRTGKFDDRASSLSTGKAEDKQFPQTHEDMWRRPHPQRNTAKNSNRCPTTAKLTTELQTTCKEGAQGRSHAAMFREGEISAFLLTQTRKLRTYLERAQLETDASIILRGRIQDALFSLRSSKGSVPPSKAEERPSRMRS